MAGNTDEVAAQWAAAVALSERPAPFSSRDGSVLRLVPVNERLCASQMQQHLSQLLQRDEHLLAEFTAQLTSVSSSRFKAKVPRHLLAWARGRCYLQAGNTRQALKDAQAAMAYAAAAGTACEAKPTATAAQPGCFASNSSKCNSSFLQAQTAPQTAAAAAAAAPVMPAAPACRWVPALLLASDAYAALEQWPQAVLHCAAAVLQAPGHAAAEVRLAHLARLLLPEQAIAFTTGGLAGLLQQLQLEAEMKLPEVMRPRPKWYYYNKWMTQRIHTALLELHLGCSLGSGTSQQLLEAAEAAADEPAIAAAAAAAGFITPGQPVLQAALSAPIPLEGGSSNNNSVGLAEGKQGLESHNCGNCSSQTHSSAGGQQQVVEVHQQQQQQQQQAAVLQLPEPVVFKLLSVDAGDLDLMIQHPAALQAQVYELLDVLDASGSQGVAAYAVPHLNWDEVRALTGPGTVGLPLGYKPTAQQRVPGKPAVPVLPAGLSTEAAGSGKELLQLTAAQGEDEAALGVTAGVGAGVTSLAGGLQMAGAGDDLVAANKGDGKGAIVGWRQRGWTRSNYLMVNGVVPE